MHGADAGAVRVGLQPHDDGDDRGEGREQHDRGRGIHARHAVHHGGQRAD